MLLSLHNEWLAVYHKRFNGQSHSACLNDQVLSSWYFRTMNAEDMKNDIPLREENLLQQLKQDKSNAETEKASRLSRLRNLNWKNIVTIGCLWLTSFIINVSFSIMGPFFPDAVCYIVDN